jgi:hypothetical protein
LICSTRDLADGIRFIGDDGWVHVNRKALTSRPEPLARETIGENEIRLYRSLDHLQNWLDRIADRRECVASPAAARRSAAMCHVGNIALRVGGDLTWDWKTERFVAAPGANNGADAERIDQANGLTRRSPREPWGSLRS